MKKYLYLLKKNKVIYPAGRGWYSNIQKEFELNIEPTEKITKLLIEKFPLLEFSCWSTEQLRGFFHHLPSQFVTFIYTDKDFLSTLRDFLTENYYNIYLNPSKIEAEKFLELKNSIPEEIKNAFDEQDIEIPFPHRTIYTGSATAPFPIQSVSHTQPD